MAVVCAACGTENREAAKFCRGCGARVGVIGEAARNPEPWAPTQPTLLGEPADERTLLVSRPAAAPAGPAAAAAAPLPDNRLPPARPAHVDAPRASGMKRWLGLVAVLLALLGAGLLWWGSASRKGSADSPGAPAVVAPVPAPAAVAAPESAGPLAPSLSSSPDAPGPGSPPSPVASTLTAPPEAAPPVAAPAAAAPSPAPAAARPRARRDAAPEPAPAAAPAPTPVPPPVVPAPVPAPASAVTSPQEACASQGFIARARCLAAECAKPALSRHPQCEAVRQQQQLEDRIRNPEGGA